MTLLAPWAAYAQTFTVYETDGTENNEYVPFQGYMADGAQHNQMIYPATDLSTDMVGKSITQMVFYIQSWGSSGTTQGNWTVSLGETTATTLSGLDNTTSLTQVYEGQMVYNNEHTTMTITFDDAYTYQGGNLLVDFNHAAAGWRRIYFYGKTVTGASYCYGSQRNFLDKVTFSYETPATCAKPNGLEATLTAGNGSIATMSWTENGTATNWVLEYGTASDFTGATSMTTGFTVSGTTVTANLTGLTAEAKYYARVKANCGGGDESAWSATCEFTPTNALTLTVYDDPSTLTTNGYIPLGSGNQDYYNHSEYIIPAAELASINGATLNSIKLYANYTLTTGSTTVYLREVKDETFSSTTPYGVAGSTTVYTGALTISSTDGMTVVFNEGYDYNGGNLLIGFYKEYVGSYTSGSFYGQNVTGASIGGYGSSSPSIAQRNFIPKTTFNYSINPYKVPKNLSVSNVTNTSATVSWNAPASGTPTGYKYQYKPDGGTWNALTSTTALSAPLSGLTASTTYTFQVQAVYSGGESDFVSTTFTTDCDAFPIPYPFGFENSEIDDLDCWEEVNIVNAGTASNSWANSNLGLEPARTGDNFYIFLYVEYTNEGLPYQTLISPELSGITNGLHVEFYYRQYENGAETFRVGYSTTNKDLASFTWGAEITNSTTEYQRFSANYPAGTKYVAIQHTSDDQYYLFLDDFLFEEAASCLEPTNVLVNNITTTGATVSWTPGATETAWDIFVTEKATLVPDDATTPTYANVTTNTNYPISGLTSGTTYYVYVRAICSENSAWSVPYVFNTECEGMPLPYSYGFEETSLPVCWSIINTNTSYCGIALSTTATNAHNGSNSLDFWRGSATGDLIAVLPLVDAAYSLSDYEFTFWAQGNGNAVMIGIMTDPDDASTFTQQGETINPTSTYTQYTVRFNEYTGSGKYVAIKNNLTVASAYTYIDDIEVNHLPACLEPSDPTVSEITNHTAKLTWTGTSASYNIDYRTAAYTDGFSEEFSTTSAPSGWTRYSGALNTDGTGPTSTYSGGWNFGTNQFSSIHAYMNVYSTNKYWLVTPSVTIGNGYNMSFDVAYTAYNSTSAAGTTGTDDRFCVLISTDEKAHWTILREWNNAGTGDAVLNDIPVTFQTINDIDISSYKGQTVYFAFYGESTTSNADNTLRIDNVSIGTPVAEGAWQHTTSATTTKTLEGLLAQRKYEVKVQGDCGTEGTSEWSGIVSFTTDIPCPAPSGLSYANLKSDHVDLSWTNAGAEDWVVAYKLSTETDFTEVPVATADVTISGNTVTYTLTGLTPEKEYTVKVKDNCEASYPGDGTSEYTSTVTFTTLKACDTPTGLTVSNIGHYSADLTWTGDSPEFIVKYRTAASIDGIIEEFTTTSAPTDWTRYSGALNTDGTGPTSTVTSGWSFGTNQFSSIHAYMNIWSTNKYWLVTPSIMVGSGYTMSFDVAYTAYNSTSAAGTTGTDDRFCVLISTDEKAHWTILREWNNDGTGDAVLNDIPATFQTINDIDISSYSGQTVYLAFYGASTTSNADNTLRIDNVAIGTTVAAGAWQTLSPNPTTTTANLTGLTAGTKYEVTVAPSCDNTLVSDTKTFTTISANEKYFLGTSDNDWSVAANWEPTGVPTIKQNVTLYANVTIPNGCVAEANNITGTTGTGAYTLTINDGGQLKHNNTGVRATVKKTITGYEASNANTKLGYYLIANPITVNLSTTTTPTIASTGLLTGTYDFYSWSSSNVGEEWRNYETSAFTTMNYSTSSSLISYLYANESNVDLTFTGNIQKSDSYFYKYLSYTASPSAFQNWNLLGNPWVCNAYLVNASTSGTGLPFYKMTFDGLEAVTAGTAIAPMEGFFYEATASGSVYVVRTEPPVTSTGKLNINLAQQVTTRDAKSSRDNAIVQFGEGSTLGKFSFSENTAKVYIPQDGKDYAIVNAENEGEMPVNFKAAENGTYTLSFTAEGVEFGYLHLIDNKTGNDVDLLATPSYTFDAQYTDYASRFKLVFATSNNSDDQFGFISNGQLILTGLTGNETIQMIDALGRVIVSTNAFNHVSTENLAPGVYVLRLINGNDVKTQKIVVK